MQIEEKDFKVIFKDRCYTLYLLKSKKEIKESDTDQFKIGGYFTVITSLIKKVIEFRNSKKYPGKEKSDILIIQQAKLQDLQLKLNLSLMELNKPIYELMTKLNIK